MPQFSNSPPIRAHVFVAACRRHLLALSEQLNRLQVGSSVNAVHQMRVASRRLRTTLLAFADFVPGKKMKRWCRSIGRAARALSEARDTDVQIELLQSLLKRGKSPAKATRPGLARLYWRWQQRRAQLQPPLARALEQLAEEGTLLKIEQWLAKFARRTSRNKKKRNQRMALGWLVCLYVRVLQYDRAVQIPAQVNELHAMRIAAKHLRYAMEALEGLEIAGLEEPLVLAKAWQQQLGDIHDLDVWLAQLPEFLAAEESRFVEFQGHTGGFAEIAADVRQFAAERRRTRAQLYAAFLRQWKREKTAPAWRMLLET